MGGLKHQETVDRSFPRARRIQATGAFARLKADGRREVAGALILNWMAARPSSALKRVIVSARGAAKIGAKTGTVPTVPSPPQTRLGVVTSRSVGGAVQRNRARRLLREAFRLNQHRIQQPTLMILVARASIARRRFAAVERDFLLCLSRAGLTRVPEAPAQAMPAAQP